MARFVPSTINITPEIVQLLEAVSRKEGELSALSRTIHAEKELLDLATVDAVHFSTRIEGNAMTCDQVTQALSGEYNKRQKAMFSPRDLREVLNYARARDLVRGWSQRGKPFNDEWVLLHHAELMRGIVRGKLAGYYREAQCAISDSATRRIVYMAPEWSDVKPLMRQLLGWVRKQRASRTSVPILAAQFHFEFVTIHPFMDGNGRLARLLTNAILFSGGYEVEKFAALEKQHEQNRSAYYRALRQLQSANYYDIPKAQDIGSWVEYWLECLVATYDNALDRVRGTIMDGSSASLDDTRLRKAEALFRRHRGLRASEYSELMGLGRTQAVADLNRLVEADVIERVGGGRSTKYRVKEKGER